MKFVAVFTLLTLSAQAQIPSLADQSRALLHSRDIHSKAWGAWYSGASHDPSMYAPLLAELRLAQPLSNSAPGTESYAYIQALLDALIQFSQGVSADDLLPFENLWRPEILILLNTNPAASEDALLNMREHPMPEGEWIAVNDLLFAISSKRFFDRTLHEIEIRHDFVITDPVQGYGSGGSIGCGGTGYYRIFSSAFPPIATYQLKTTMAPGDTLLEPRPVPVYYRRTVITGGLNELTGTQSPVVSSEARQTLMARFLGAAGYLSEEKSEALFHAKTFIGWQSPAQTETETQTALAQQSAAIQSLIADIEQQGLLQAAGMRLPVTITIDDQRQDRTQPLPTIPPHEITLR
jgi:hypothetical protein